MIVLETSALLAIVLAEPGHSALVMRLGDHRREVLLPPHCLLEAHLVLTARHPLRLLTTLATTIDGIDPTYPPFTLDHAQVARQAFDRFGKGRHRAALNFGDCMSYAVAKVAGVGLLYAGEDFAETDVMGV